MELPESWRFLGPMWWVLHLVAIGLVFYIGYVVGKNSGTEEEEPKGWESNLQGGKGRKDQEKEDD